ncbi:hypothetical protein EDB19DRAFT_1960437 [Suillus lakei]|nr:hypothetical protein EDB19DRAFT_1960437 [Suillus lakei]
MSSPKVWFIMGTSSGFRRSMTEYTLNQGNTIIATLCKPQVLSDLTAQYPADKLLVLKVDVTKQEDIDEAFARMCEAFGRLDIVFNNAGYGLLGEVEGTPVDKVWELFEMNFLGATNISCAAVKFFREVNELGKGGMILQVSLMAGFNALPGLTYYAAITGGLSDGLAKELPASWNIMARCSLPQSIFLPKHPAYADESFVTSVLHQRLDGMVFEGDADKFTWTIYKVVQGGKIPKWLPMGLDALEMLNLKIENLKVTVDETKGWSVDLKRASGGVALIIPSE